LLLTSSVAGCMLKHSPGACLVNDMHQSNTADAQMLI